MVLHTFFHRILGWIDPLDFPMGWSAGPQHTFFRRILGWIDPRDFPMGWSARGFRNKNECLAIQRKAYGADSRVSRGWRGRGY